MLIVCGVNSLKYNWQSEISIHSDEKGWVLGTRFRKTTGKPYEGSTRINWKTLTIYRIADIL